MIPRSQQTECPGPAHHPIAPRFRNCGALVAVLAAGLGWSGCLVEEDPNTFHYEGTAPAAAPKPVPGAYSFPPEPPLTDSLALHDFVEKFHGRVVLLDFWANWCARSRAELPDLVRLQQALGTSGFQVLSCNLDDPSHWPMTTVATLKSVQANFPCVVVPRQSKAPLRTWLGEDWNYTLPARFVIGADGQVLARLYDDASFENVAAASERAVRQANTVASIDSRAAAPSQLRVRLINVLSGEVHNYPPIYSDSNNAGELGVRAAELLPAKIGRRTRRVAILPVLTRGGVAPDASGLGPRVADRLIQRLRELGYMDLVEPPRAERELERSRLTPSQVEYDTTAIVGRIDADYAVLAYVAGPSSPGIDAEPAPADPAANTDRAAMQPPDAPARRAQIAARNRGAE